MRGSTASPQDHETGGIRRLQKSAAGLRCQGALLENLVFTALRRLDAEIFYYRTRTGREVDFIVSPRGRPRRLVQVCESLRDAAARKREIAALTDAMAELGLQAGTIVTRNEGERIETDQGVIDVLPVWRFLLTLPDHS